MPIEPYGERLENCLEYLSRQTADLEVIVSEHEVSKWIRLNELLNNGVKKSSGAHLWFCNADFVLEDNTLLERMLNKDVEVIFPMYLSPVYGKYKPSDGAPFVRRGVMDRFGKFNENHMGISRATFVFVEWCLRNTQWHSSREFLIGLNHDGKRHAQIHYPTLQACSPLYKKCVKEFSDKGLWLS